MPEPITLGVAAALLLAKTIEKAIDKTADRVTDPIPVTVSAVVNWVRGHFGERAELTTLEDAPDSARRQNALAEIIDAELIDDEDAHTQLLALLDAHQRALAAQPRSEYNIGSIRADRGGVAVGGNITGGVTAGYKEATTPPGGGAEDPPTGP